MDSETAERSPAPGVTIIIPVYQGETTIRPCLDSVFASTLQDFEVIVIDDGSTDATVDIVRSYPVRLMQLPGNQGPAAARNAGAFVAKGPLLYFLDSDILMQPDTLARTVRALEERPDVCAVFGSFGKDTPPSNFVSNYKNLLHHYTHQTANPESSSFCGGFSAIRRDSFMEFGGFDPEHKYLEDVEFGYRLRAAGHLIWLRSDLQLTHCKRYSLLGLIRSDVFRRAVPWMRLYLERRTFANDLSTQTHHLLSLPLAVGVVLSPLVNKWLWMPLLLAWIIANRGFLDFLRRERGLGFAARGAALCMLGYLYSGVGAAIAVSSYLWRRIGIKRPAEDLSGA